MKVSPGFGEPVCRHHSPAAEIPLHCPAERGVRLPSLVDDRLYILAKEMMGLDLFTREDLKDIMEFRAFPSLSFYLPAHRAGTETRQSATRLKNLLKQAEDLLRERGLRPAQIRHCWNRWLILSKTRSSGIP
jgi:hypothetical protein